MSLYVLCTKVSIHSVTRVETFVKNTNIQTEEDSLGSVAGGPLIPRSAEDPLTCGWLSWEVSANITLGGGWSRLCLVVWWPQQP